MLNKKALAASVSAPPAVFVEDVFSTYLYAGNSTNNTISNGIDLSTKGGLVWMKGRTIGDGTQPNALFDTARGLKQLLRSNTTNAQVDESGGGGGGIQTWNTNGFTITDGGFNGYYNQSGENYCSWTFRKQAKFFDIVTWSGNDTAGRTISHSLGSVPGMIIVKATSRTSGWTVYHRSTGATQYLNLNTTAAAGTTNIYWNDTAPTSTVFTVGNSAAVNGSGETYIAYIFAHDAGGFGTAGTDNVISCGTLPDTAGTVVNLGYEPQYIMWKKSGSTSYWYIFDVMRGMSYTADKTLSPNASIAELTYTGVSLPFVPTATGFTWLYSGWDGTAGADAIYMAIRRPMKVPTTGTSVFAPVQKDFDGLVNSGFPTDLIFGTQLEGGNNWRWLDRLRGGDKTLSSNATSAESTENYWKFDNNSGVVLNIGSTFSTWFWCNFKRAPGFFDTVCYTGTGSNRTVAHNLTVVPELMIVKQRNTARSWCVYSAPTGNNNYLLLDSTDPKDELNVWQNTTPTASVFSVTTNAYVNQSGGTYVAYLFATCPGVSKVGSYTGTGATQTINCAFTGGARFVLIKRTDSTGDWYIWNSARGIVSGNDPYLLLNSTAAEVTSTDYIDPVSSGFEISSTAPAAINANGGSFIFLAIA